jgi:hypothetical protein
MSAPSQYHDSEAVHGFKSKAPFRKFHPIPLFEGKNDPIDSIHGPHWMQLFDPGVGYESSERIDRTIQMFGLSQNRKDLCF